MPTLDFETQVRTEFGPIHIAGLDEAGRGAIAGPVVAAAVILPLNEPARIEALAEVNDSKQLTSRKREGLFDLIRTQVLAYGIGSVPAETIDEIGIIPATKMAMLLAVKQLDPPAGFLLVDGRLRFKNNPLPQKSLIRGDSKSLSIAAASILAKVTRDRQMIDLGHYLPDYGFARHKGYGTRQHLAALERLGPTSFHRHSFAPIRRELF